MDAVVVMPVAVGGGWWRRFGGRCVRVHGRGRGRVHMRGWRLQAVCPKFLRGNCSGPCGLSHKVAPDKMPTCKRFLRGSCNTQGCPYRHVMVSRAAAICTAFLRGYCPRGAECPDRHEVVPIPKEPKAADSNNTVAGRRPRPERRQSSDVAMPRSFQQLLHSGAAPGSAPPGGGRRGGGTGFVLGL